MIRLWSKTFFIVLGDLPSILCGLAKMLGSCVGGWFNARMLETYRWAKTSPCLPKDWQLMQSSVFFRFISQIKLKALLLCDALPGEQWIQSIKHFSWATQCKLNKKNGAVLFAKNVLNVTTTSANVIHKHQWIVKQYNRSRSAVYKTAIL